MVHREARQHAQIRQLQRRRQIRARQRQLAHANGAATSVLADAMTGLKRSDRDLRAKLVFGLQRLRIASGEFGRHLGQARGLLQERISEPRPWNSATIPSPTSLFGLISRSPELPPKTAILGVAEDSRPVVMEFGQRHVTNVLIAGAVGAGKTTLLRTMAASLAMENRQSVLQLIVMDASVQDSRGSLALLRPLDNLPHMLFPVVDGPERVVEALSFLASELAHRRGQEQYLPVVIVMVDNLDQLSGRHMALASENLAELLQYGSQVGFHLVASAREVDGTFFDELIKANLPVRLVGRARDARTANLASGIPGSGAELLDGPGQFLAVMDGSPALRFRAARLADSELHTVLEELHRCRPRPLLARPARRAETSNGINGAIHPTSPAWSQPASDEGEPTVTDERENESTPD